MSGKRMTIADAEKRGFIQGYGIAVGVIVRLHDQPGIAIDLLRESGFVITDFERAGLEDFDLKPLRVLFREMERVACAKKRTLPHPHP